MSTSYRTIRLPNAHGIEIVASDGGAIQVAWSVPGWHGPLFAFKSATRWSRSTLVDNPERFGDVASVADAMRWAKRFSEGVEA